MRLAGSALRVGKIAPSTASLHGVAVAVLLLTVLWPRESAAVPITYRFWGIVSGNVSGTLFYDAAIEFELHGDTDYADTFSNASTNGYRSFIAPGITSGSTVTLDGFGTGLVTEPVLVLANPNDYCQCVGFKQSVNTGFGDVFDLFQTPFTLANPYDLKTSTGAVSGRVVTFGSSSITLQTKIGMITLLSGHDGYFQATVSEVPVPAIGWTLIAAFGGLLPFSRRRRNALHRRWC